MDKYEVVIERIDLDKAIQDQYGISLMKGDIETVAELNSGEAAPTKGNKS